MRGTLIRSTSSTTRKLGGYGASIVEAGGAGNVTAGEEGGGGGGEEERSGGVEEAADAGSMDRRVPMNQAGRQIQVRERFALRVGCIVGAGVRWR